MYEISPALWVVDAREVIFHISLVVGERTITWCQKPVIIWEVWSSEDHIFVGPSKE